MGGYIRIWRSRPASPATVWPVPACCRSLVGWCTLPAARCLCCALPDARCLLAARYLVRSTALEDIRASYTARKRASPLVYEPRILEGLLRASYTSRIRAVTFLIRKYEARITRLVRGSYWPKARIRGVARLRAVYEARTSSSALSLAGATRSPRGHAPLASSFTPGERTCAQRLSINVETQIGLKSQVLKR